MRSRHSTHVWLFAFVDVLLIITFTLAAFSFLALANINPKAQAHNTPPPGNLMVTIAWPEGDTDVDLWLGAPGDQPVGYSHKSGRIWDLLRDDMGNEGDTTPLNFESAYSRGIPDGEYVVDIHCYRCNAVPVPVTVEVGVAHGPTIFKGVVPLLADKQERTVIRFTMKDGQIVPNSENQVYKPLHDMVEGY